MLHYSKKISGGVCFALFMFISLTVFAAEPAQAATLKLPSGVKTIEAEAFYGDTSLYEVVLPDGLTTIGSKAFANSSLRKINLPASITNIAPDAFNGCDMGNVLVRAGTYAANYAALQRWVAPVNNTAQWDFYKNTLNGDIFLNNSVLDYNICAGDLDIVIDVTVYRLLLQASINNGPIRMDYYAYFLNEEPDFSDLSQIKRRLGGFLWNNTLEDMSAVRYMIQGADNGYLTRITTEQMRQAPYLVIQFGITKGDDNNTDWYSFGIRFYEEPLDPVIMNASVNVTVDHQVEIHASSMNDVNCFKVYEVFGSNKNELGTIQDNNGFFTLDDPSYGEHVYYVQPMRTLEGRLFEVEGGKTVSCQVTPVDPSVRVTGVTLNKASMTLVKGKSEPLTANILPSDATNKNVTWTSSNISVATVSNGVVSAKSAGQTVITVKTEDGSFIANCTITVNEVVVPTAITLEREGEQLLGIGESMRIKAILTPSDAVTSINWEVEASSISVDQNGIVTAMSADTLRYVTATTSNGLSARILVRPVIKLNEMQFEQATYTVHRGGTTILYLVYNYGSEELPLKKYREGTTFTSSNQNVARIIDFTESQMDEPEYTEGKCTRLELLSTGTTIITATAPNGVTASCVVNVIPTQLCEPVVDYIRSVNSGLRIQWDQVDDVDSDQPTDVNYHFYICQEADANDPSNYVLADTITINESQEDGGFGQYTYTKAISGRTYCFYLEAYKNGWISSRSVVYTVTYTSSTNESPMVLATPSNVTVNSLAQNHVRLTWTPVTGATDYVIYWSEDNANSLTNRTSAYFNASSGNYCFIDFDNLSTGHIYYFSVQAKDSSNHSSARSAVVSTVTRTRPAPSSVSLNNGSLTVTQGTKCQLVATVLPVDASSECTWTTSNGNVATVSNTGMVNVIGLGTATITVKTVDGEKIATCTVTGKPLNIPVNSITISKPSATMLTGEQHKLTITIQPSNATNQSVTWTSSNPAVATVANGTVTAKAEGTASITVTTQDGGFSKTCVVTVNPIPVPVNGVTLSKSNVKLNVGNSEMLTATVLPMTATNKGVSWKSSNSSVVTVSNGVITGKTQGSTTITVTTTEGSYTATCLITVVQGPGVVTDIHTGTVGPYGTILEWKTISGATKYRIYKSTSNTRPLVWSYEVTDDGSQVWKSQNLNNLQADTSYYIWVSALNENGGESFPSNPFIIKTPKIPQSVSILQNDLPIDSLYIEIGNSVQLSTQWLPSGCYVGNSYIWKTQNSNIVTVNNGLVSGVAVGTTTISVGQMVGSNTVVKRDIQVNVINPFVYDSENHAKIARDETIVIDPRLDVGDTIQLQICAPQNWTLNVDSDYIRALTTSGSANQQTTVLFEITSRKSDVTNSSVTISYGSSSFQFNLQYRSYREIPIILSYLLYYRGEDGGWHSVPNGGNVDLPDDYQKGDPIYFKMAWGYHWAIEPLQTNLYFYGNDWPCETTNNKGWQEKQFELRTKYMPAAGQTAVVEWGVFQVDGSTMEAYIVPKGTNQGTQTKVGTFTITLKGK